MLYPSKYVHFVLSQEEVLNPQTMVYSEERIEYVKNVGLLLEAIMNSRHNNEEKRITMNSIPLVNKLYDVVEEGNNLKVNLRAGAYGVVSRIDERLRIACTDTRRSTEKIFYINSKEKTKSILALLRYASSGTDASLFLQKSRSLNLNTDKLFQVLTQRGVLEETEESRNTERVFLKSSNREYLTWLGHASLLFQTASVNVLIDPVFTPKIFYKDEELKRTFNEELADPELLSGIGQQPVCYWELPKIDVVCITHQDVDHFDLSSLLYLPEDTTIIVPKNTKKQPWNINIKEVLESFLHFDKIIELGHREEVKVKDVCIKALPFFGEFPPSLSHEWNSYSIEGHHSVVVATSDSVVDENWSDIFLESYRNTNKPICLCARPMLTNNYPKRAYYDDIGHPLTINFNRLYPWYLTPLTALQPSLRPGVLPSALSRMSQQSPLKYFFPYAIGGTPWMRVEELDKLCLIMQAYPIQRQELQLIDDLLNECASGVKRLKCKYGNPISFH